MKKKYQERHGSTHVKTKKAVYNLDALNERGWTTVYDTKGKKIGILRRPKKEKKEHKRFGGATGEKLKELRKEASKQRKEAHRKTREKRMKKKLAKKCQK